MYSHVLVAAVYLYASRWSAEYGSHSTPTMSPPGATAIAPSPLLGRPCQRRWLGEVNLGIRRCTVLKRRVLAVLGALLTARLLSGWAKRS